jgi:hypothetical protein
MRDILCIPRQGLKVMVSNRPPLILEVRVRFSLVGVSFERRGRGRIEGDECLYSCLDVQPRPFLTIHSFNATPFHSPRPAYCDLEKHGYRILLSLQ